MSLIEERQLLPIADRRASWSFARQVLMGPRGLVGLSSIVLLATTAISLITPALLGVIVNIATRHENLGALTAPVLGLVAVAIGQGIGGALGDGLVARLGGGVLAKVREQVMDRALCLPLQTIERAGAGDLVSRVTGDVDVLSDAIDGVLPAIIGSALTIALTIGALALLDWRFALAALCAAPVQLVTLRWYLAHAGPLYAAERVAEGGRAQRLLDAIAGARTVRAFRLSARELGEVESQSLRAVDFALAGTRLRSRFYGRLNIAELVGMSALLAMGYVLVRDHTVTIGAATAAVLYFHRLFDPINALLGLFDDAQEAGAALARLAGVASLPTAEAAPSLPWPSSGAVVVRGLSYSYEPGHEVLSDIDLDIAPGERIALVGASGAGKTTLAKLLAGIYQSDRGELQVRDDAMFACPLEQLSGRIVLVTQELHVFSGSLAEDLRLARSDASDADLWASLELAGATDWVRALSGELATVVGEGGVSLDPTRAQQIALARLALAAPALALLDEASAEAGSRGARRLEAAAERITDGRSAVIVAHRLSQAASCDRIIVLEHGCVREVGTHEELLAQDGRYGELWKAWSDARSSPTDSAAEPSSQGNGLTD